MRRIACAVRRLRRLTIVVLGMAVAFIAALMPATAADFIPSGSPIPQGIRWANATPTGVNTSAWATFNGTVSKFPVPVSSSTLGSLAKGALKKGIPIAGTAMMLKDIINGVGWVIDELQGQVMDGQSIPQQMLGQGGYYWFISINGTTYYASAVSGVLGPCNLVWSPCSVGEIFDNGNSARIYRNLPGNPDFTVSKTWVSGSEAMTAPDYSTGQDASPVSNYDLGQLLKNHPEIVNAILIDPQTGAPIRTQELVNALNALAAQLAAANGDPAPTPVEVDPDIETGTDTPSQTEWPGFCDWAPTVCEFVEWMTKPEPEEEQPEVPWDETPPETVEWSSGLGAGSCPAPVSFSVTIGPVSASPEFELQPICDFGEKIRPLVIALASLIGVFIVGGWRNGKNA